MSTGNKGLNLIGDIIQLVRRVLQSRGNLDAQEQLAAAIVDEALEEGYVLMDRHVNDSAALTGVDLSGRPIQMVSIDKAQAHEILLTFFNRQGSNVETLHIFEHKDHISGVIENNETKEVAQIYSSPIIKH